MFLTFPPQLLHLVFLLFKLTLTLSTALLGRFQREVIFPDLRICEFGIRIALRSNR
jgi:hypothetical protein